MADDIVGQRRLHAALRAAVDERVGATNAASLAAVDERVEASNVPSPAVDERVGPTNVARLAGIYERGGLVESQDQAGSTVDGRQK